MARLLQKTRMVCGREIRIYVLDTGCGLNVLIEGGDKPHIGALALSSGLEDLDAYIEYPSHKEGELCRKWARELSKNVGYPVAVTGGIHYNDATKEEISAIMSALDSVLVELCLERLS